MKQTGKVKWFSPDKKYGFIKPDNNKQDVFIHLSVVKSAGLNDLKEGQKIEYEVVTKKGKPSATNISLIN